MSSKMWDDFEKKQAEMYEEMESAAELAKYDAQMVLPLPIIEKALIPREQILKIKYNRRAASRHWNALDCDGHGDDEDYHRDRYDEEKYHEFLQGIGTVTSKKEKAMRYEQLILACDCTHFLVLKQGGSWVRMMLALLSIIWYHSMKLAIQLGQKEWDLHWVHQEHVECPEEDEYDDSEHDTDEEDEAGQNSDEYARRKLMEMGLNLIPPDMEPMEYLQNIRHERMMMKQSRNYPVYKAGNIPIASTGYDDASVTSQQMCTPCYNLERISELLARLCAMVPKNRGQMIKLYEEIKRVPNEIQRLQDMIKMVDQGNFYFRASDELYKAAPEFMMAVLEFVRMNHWSKAHPKVDAVVHPPRKPRMTKSSSELRFCAGCAKIIV